METFKASRLHNIAGRGKIYSGDANEEFNIGETIIIEHFGKKIKGEILSIERTKLLCSPPRALKDIGIIIREYNK